MRKVIDIGSVCLVVLIAVLVIFFPFGYAYQDSAFVNDVNKGISYYQENASVTITFIDILKSYEEQTIMFIFAWCVSLFAAIYNLKNKKTINNIITIVGSAIIFFTVSMMYSLGLNAATWDLLSTSADNVSTPYGTICKIISIILILVSIVTMIIKSKSNDKNIDNSHKLKKYKDLLDSGVITQEEFDAKKKQLLGL